MHNTKLYNPTYYFGYSFFHFKINGKFITVIDLIKYINYDNFVSVHSIAKNIRNFLSINHLF